jgi:lipoprotein-anchoring transpeptidase ErfK/SrfK
LTVVPEPAEPVIIPRQFPWRAFLFGAGATLAILLLTWAVGNLYFTKLQIGNTAVPGKISGSSLESLISNEAAGYQLKLRYPDGHVQTFSLAQMGLTPQAAETVPQTRKAQRTPQHLFAWWRPVPIRITLRVNNPALTSFIAAHARIVTAPATDAHIGIDAGKVIVTPEVLGKQYGFMNAAGSILDTARHLHGSPLPMTSVALEPNVTSKTLSGTKNQLETILSQHLSIKIGDQTVTPSPGDIGTWLVITPTGTGASLAVNQDEITAYIKDLAATKSTAPRSEVVSDTSGDVLAAGAKGVTVGNTDETASDLGSHLLEAKGNNLSLPVSFTAFKTVNAPTSGKWIEVDTSTKRMYAYDQGELVRTFLVSAGAALTPTVTGHFAIYAKYRSQDMHGGNADGSNYFQPDVPYVNYFYRDYAIHGNYWRPSSYFGNINSSHGCVGLPVTDGAWIYSWAPIGTPVIVHT